MCTCPFYCLYRLDLLVISRRPCIVWTFHYHWSHWSGLLAFQRTYRPCQLSWTIFGQISSTACTASRGPYSETHSSPLGTVSSTPTFRWSLTPRPSGSLSRCPHSAIPWCAAPLTDGRPLLRQPETICERVAISCCWYARHALSYLFQTIWLWPSPGPRTRQRIRQCTKWWRRPVSRTRPPSTWLWVRWTSGSMRWSSSSCRAFSCRCSASYWCWPYVASVNAVNSCFVEPERKAAPEQKSSVSPSRRHARATTRRRCSSALSCYFLSPSFHKASLHWSLSVILDPEVHRAQSTGPCQPHKPSFFFSSLQFLGSNTVVLFDIHPLPVSPTGTLQLFEGVLAMVSGLKPIYFPTLYIPLGDIMDIAALVNNAVNFVLYCAMSRQFRQTFIELFMIKSRLRHSMSNTV